MSGPTASLGVIRRLVVGAVILWTALLAFAPGLGLPALGGILFAAGAWLSVAEAPRGRRLATGLVGGLVTAGVGVLLGLLTSGRVSLLPLALVAALVLLDLAGIRRVLRLAGVEVRKLAKGRLLRTGLLATAALTLLATLTYDAVPGATGWTRAAHGLGVGQWVGDVFLLVLGATALAGEATGGTLKMMLPHAYRRSDWILAKALVLVGVAVVFAAVVAAASLLPAAAQDGLGDVLTEPLFGESPDSAEVFAPARIMASHFLVTVLAGCAAGAALAIVGLFLSTLFDGVVAALSSAFLVFAGIRLADVLLAIPREDLVHRVFAWPPVQLREVLGKLGRGLSERWDPSLLPTTLGLAAVTAALLLLLAGRIFQVRDVHA